MTPCKMSLLTAPEAKLHVGGEEERAEHEMRRDGIDVSSIDVTQLFRLDQYKSGLDASRSSFEHSEECGRIPIAGKYFE